MYRAETRQYFALLIQLPPRSTRPYPTAGPFEPGSPEASSSYHRS